ncbi:MAG: hypothetical protein KAU95_00870 [Candidatus Aenigmarchaeota archaeon]|nr:hypothetical protein [Candidatus Aenigmarchaeota archaeon]
MKVKAFAPGHISSIFRICSHSRNCLTGSRGAGIVIDKGVETEVRLKKSSGIKIFFNNKQIDFRVSEVMTRKMLKSCDGLEIYHKTELPLGAGFGISGASILSLGLCLNKLFDLKLSLNNIGKIAHETEVELGTGLGDVGPMLTGGIEMRKKEGAPGYNIIDCINSTENDFQCFSFGGISTKDIIKSDKRKKLINKYADVCLGKLFGNPTFENFMEQSNKFAEKTNLMSARLKIAIEKLNSFPNCHASMIMLGESGFVFGADKNIIDNVLKGADVFKVKVGFRPPTLL